MKPAPDLTTVAWRKSSHSDGGDNNCLEVADGHPALVPVRDSKIPDGPVLLFDASAWTSFVTGTKKQPH